MSKTTAYIIAEKIQRKVEGWAKKGVSTWHATDIMPIIENYIFDSSKMQDMGGMVESCAKQVIAEFGEWMKKSTKGTKVDCTYAAPIQMLLDSATAHLIIKIEKSSIEARRNMDGFAMAEKECIELKDKIAKNEAEVARLTENLENASTVQADMRTMLAKHGDMRAAIAMAETALKAFVEWHEKTNTPEHKKSIAAKILEHVFGEDDEIPLFTDDFKNSKLHAVAASSLAAIAALKGVSEESSATPAPADGPIPAAAQMPCCPRCGDSRHIEEAMPSMQHRFNSWCPTCEEYFDPQPEGGEPCAEQKPKIKHQHCQCESGGFNLQMSCPFHGKPEFRTNPSTVASNAAPEQVDPAAATAICPHCGFGLLWSEDRGPHCDGCDEYEPELVDKCELCGRAASKTVEDEHENSYHVCDNCHELAQHATVDVKRAELSELRRDRERLEAVFENRWSLLPIPNIVYVMRGGAVVSSGRTFREAIDNAMKGGASSNKRR